MGHQRRNLVIDIGNSGTKLACYADDELLHPVTRLTNDNWQEVNRMVTNLGAQNIIYSTVANVPPSKWLDKWKTEGIGIYSIDRSRPLPFSSDYLTMDTLGQDRIAAVAGTLGLMTTSRLIVDLGSCVTMDLVDASGRYLGGNISPGLNMRLRAMHEFTVRLPLVEIGDTSEPVGRSTLQALRHGGQLGVVYEVEGLYHRLRTIHRDLCVVLTGGDAPHVIESFSIPVLHRPNLVLRGLNQILSNYVNNDF